MRTSKSKTAPKKEAKQYLSAMLPMLEKVVMGAHTMYLRAYAWLKLVTIWAVVRGEDSTWLEESSLRFDPQVGLQGNLKKSKTTGPGKKVKHREVFVSVEAYIVEKGWLKEGWELWQKAPQPRENFLSLPDPSFETFREVGAEVQDRVALTRHLLEKCELMSKKVEEEKFNNVAARFWTEHSSRATLPSWARALGVPKEVTDRLGYWAAGAESAETYIRTHRSLTGRVQSTAATFIREALSKNNKEEEFPDIFGEKEVVDELKRFTELKIGSAEKYVTRIKLPWAKVSPTRALLKYGWTIRDQQDEAAEEKKARQATSQSSSEAEEADPTIKTPKTAAWVITQPASKRQLGCLHVIGRCYRIPGLHYKKWLEVSESVESTAFSSACKQCFPLGYPIIKDAHLETIEAAVDSGMINEAPEEGESSSDA